MPGITVAFDDVLKGQINTYLQRAIEEKMLADKEMQSVEKANKKEKKDKDKEKRKKDKYKGGRDSKASGGKDNKKKHKHKFAGGRRKKRGREGECDDEDDRGTAGAQAASLTAVSPCGFKRVPWSVAVADLWPGPPRKKRDPPLVL